MTERTEEEVLSGLLQVSVGGIVKPMPTLPIKYVPEWAQLLDALTPTEPSGDPREGFTLIARVTLAGLLDLVVAYDRTGALGGREWLEEHADAQQLKAAAVQMAGNAFPLGDGASVVAQMLSKMLFPPDGSPILFPPDVVLTRESSTNGASRNGASRRKRSGRSLIPSS
jgi:hypothetical protein